MRRRFQAGAVRERSARSPVWEGRYHEPVLVADKLKEVRRAVILGLFRSRYSRTSWGTRIPKCRCSTLRQD